MEILKQSLDLSSLILLNLTQQDKIIDNINDDTNYIEKNISFSEHLLFRIKNFFYRITNKKEEHLNEDKYLTQDNINLHTDVNSDVNKESINVLKTNNILIGKLLDNQNEKLNSVKDKNINNSQNLKNILRTLS